MWKLRKFAVSIQFQIITATTTLSIFTILGLPSLAQETELDVQSIPVEVIESEIEEEAKEPLEAITIENPDIPTGQLEIMLKPLPKEQIRAEADAWYGLLQEKAQEISDLELRIEQQGGEVEGDIDSEKEESIVAVTELETEQTSLVSRLSAVLDSLDSKGGDSSEYRQYLEAVSGIEFNITDTEGLGLRFKTWLQSEEGGIRWSLNLLKVFGILVAAVVIAPRAGGLANRALTRVDNISTLFRGFIVTMVKRTVLALGGLLAIASVGISLGPILAVAGGASFILAFALQSNLGNFASGLMLLLYKPFDVNDEVEIAGEWALVREITLANTKLQSWNHGRIISIPNSTVWGSTIINRTPKDGIKKFSERLFVNVNQDLVKAKRIVDEVIKDHPLVLKDYWHGTFLCKVNESAVIAYVARCKVSDYWTLYEELMLQAHSRLRQEGIVLSTPEHHVSFTPTNNSGNGKYELSTHKTVKRSQSEMGIDLDPEL